MTHRCIATFWLGASAAASAGAIFLGGACLPGSGPGLIDPPDAEPPNGPSLDEGGMSPNKGDVDLGDPFAIDGLIPSHGPFSGGTRAQLAGHGFPTKLRVWIGGTELASSAIFASDPTRAAVQTPPGAPGPADVKIRDDATAQERTLAAGFFYDAFVITPSTGATTGGTRIALLGSGTQWKTGVTVALAGKACTGVAVQDATHLQCTTPAGAPGVVDVTVTPAGQDAGQAALQARDAFTYNDSNDGFRGGLSGGALSGSLNVLAFDAYEGVPIPGATAIAGGVLATALTQKTNAAGVALITSTTLMGKVTVTVVAKCHQPLTFVDVPVDTVTAYLTPTLDPLCAMGDPPSTGGRGGTNAGEIDGELIWPGGVEFAKSAWNTVPEPAKATERLAAYVFTASGSPLSGFSLPDPTTATTPMSPGANGYGYAIPVGPGNLTVYAVAGIEDRSVMPPRFLPYVMGAVRGVSVTPGGRTVGVDIPMTTLLDHEVSLAPQPPAPGLRGPDRLVTQLAISLGASAYAILPAGIQVSLLPVSGNVNFVGVPSLDGTLAGESYVIGASAVTGTNWAYPASVVAQVKTTDANTPVTLSGFLAVPTLIEPAASSWGGTHVSLGTTGTFDMIELSISSGGGLSVWTIVAPGGTASFDVPDIGSLPDNVGLVHGTIQTTAYVARITPFSYATLRNGQLTSDSWSAYAFDALSGAY